LEREVAEGSASVVGAPAYVMGPHSASYSEATRKGPLE
jgi:hypothetical protein